MFTTYLLHLIGPTADLSLFCETLGMSQENSYKNKH